ncbi:MAG: DUF58 domain-containing protein [Chloroflexi bacterium]|nr:DUF58 domain-containing protein [Chloroflexota bacterium]
MIPAALLPRLDQLSLVSRSRRASVLHGERRSRAGGAAREFVEYRGYVPGDALRRVDWNLYGRSDRLFVKRFEDQQVLAVHVLVDASRSMDYGEPNKLHFARQVAAALAYIGLADFDQVALGSLDGDRAQGADLVFRPAGGRSRAPALLSALTRLEPRREAGSGETTDLASTLAAYTRRRPEPGLALLISDLLSPSWEPGIHRLLAHRHEVVVLHVLAPAELDPPSAEEVRLVDRETGRAVEVRLDRAALDRYRQRLHQWLAAIETLCARLGIRYQRLPTTMPLAQVVLDRLASGGIVR